MYINKITVKIIGFWTLFKFIYYLIFICLFEIFTDKIFKYI
jgi:hypothetical protein